MGNNNNYSIKHPSKLKFQNPFSPNETLFLWNSFTRLTNGKDKFNFSSFLKLCLTYRPNENNSSNYDNVAKIIFRVIDTDSDDTVKFEDYLQTCYIITKGCIESKLELLFYLLKDQIYSKLTKKNIKGRLKDLSQFICPVRAKELNVKFNVDISKELKIIKSLFQQEELQISEQTFIQRFFKKINDALHMICILELLILPLSFGLEMKLKNKIYRMPLIYINSYELHQQSYNKYSMYQMKKKRRNDSKPKKILIRPKEPKQKKKKDSKVNDQNELDFEDDKVFSEENEDIKSNSKDTIFIDNSMNNEPPKENKKSRSNENIDYQKTYQRTSILISQKSFFLPETSTNGNANRIPSPSVLQNFGKKFKSLRNRPNCPNCNQIFCKCFEVDLKQSTLNSPKEQTFNNIEDSEDIYDTKKTFIVDYEKKDSFDRGVPLGIYLLCKELIEKMKETNYTASKFEEVIWTKPNKTNCSAIQAAFETNYAHSLITKHFTTAELLHTLKNVLQELPAPLFTWSLSTTALSISLEKSTENEKKEFLKTLLSSIPSPHLSTIRCLVNCFSEISKGDKKIQSVLSSFFGSSFVRFPDSDNTLAYTPLESLTHKSSIETTPKDFVNFLLEEKDIFSKFDNDTLDETILTPILHSILNSSRLNLSYSDQYINPIIRTFKLSTDTKTSQTSSYSTESYYISSNALSSSQRSDRSDSKNSYDFEIISLVKKNSFLG